jgi:hypothetical protein
VIAMTTEIFDDARMSELLDIERLLESSGYRYHCENMHFVNRTTKRVFSIEFVESHSLQEIRRVLEEVPATNEWIFHFNKPPSDWGKRDLIQELEK